MIDGCHGGVHSEFIAERKLPSSGLLRRGTHPLQEKKVAHIIDDIGRADPYL